MDDGGLMALLADPHVADALERLRRDLRATGCGDYVYFVADEAANVATFVFVEDRIRYVEKVVEDVQQRLHDEFIDTTWPACPEHPNHPLDFTDGAWRCPRGAVVVGLGKLTD
jgi:hypothetical protein